MRRYRLVRRAAVIYVVLLHVLVGVLVVKTDFLPRVGKRLGLVPPDEREEWFARLALPVVEQMRQDQAVAGSALIVLGDSIAEQIDATRLAGDAVNYGIPGDTTRTLLWRLPSLGSVERARAIVVNVGANDLRYRPVPAVAADYGALLTRLPPSAALVAISPLPVDQTVAGVGRSRHLRNATLRSLNAALRPMCEARPNCRFLDAWPVFSDGAAGGLRPFLHIGDGQHLSPAGSRALEALIRA
ncbi:MAG TPA: GDSL-type esterase/lipase family protein, partial [Acetobacteraceae bacterium]|nr:GDSL-type esterase/lipase family protein [Acetobacteraceae bacterium]